MNNLIKMNISKKTLKKYLKNIKNILILRKEIERTWISQMR